MSAGLHRFAAALLLCVVFFDVELALAQGVTAQVSGVVVDTSNAVVPGATVTITNADTNWRRGVVTGIDGQFAFVDVLPGTYHVSVALVGFKTLQRKDVIVASTDRVDLASLLLVADGVKETILVQKDAGLVQTTTGARGGSLTGANFDEIALKGRDALGLLKLMPGVVDTNTREAPSWTLLAGLAINGRSSGFNLAYDGVTNKEAGNPQNLASPSVDSIAEIRVQSANFQAEYGRSSGASITVITRSGSKDFRGSAGFYKRDAALNGNEYLRKQHCEQGNRLECEPSLYRFDNVAWTLSGPILVPSTEFNRQRNRLFFFWSQELLARTDPGTLNLRRVPTSLERAGDFSQTVDSNGNRIFIRDPERDGPCNVANGGTGCFADNIIPRARIDPTGQALLNLFPMQNTIDPSNQYNYAYQMVQDMPRNDQVLRVDWNVGPRTTVYGRLQFGYEKRAGPVAMFGFGGGWPQMASKFESESVSYVTTLLHAINPTTFLEATAGVNWLHQYASPFNQEALDANNRAKVLPDMPQFFPEANPLDLLPNATFTGGITTGGAASLGLFQYERRFPYYGRNTIRNFSVSVTKVLKSHNVKTGIFVEYATKPVQQRSFYNGTFSFNTDAANPLNTNVGFANALLGAVTSFQQSDKRPIGHGRFVNTECYAQDNWRIGRTFTIDAGVRFYYLTPTRSEGDQVAQFEPDVFDPAAAPVLYVPVRVGNSRRALNPLTGDDSLPALYIGRPIPGTGDFYNGTQLYEGTTQRRSPFEAAPRLGFAWNVTGDGRTAIRGGAGAFYDRYADNDILELAELPPLVHTYTANYTTIAELKARENNPRTETTNAMRRIQEFVPPIVYNWSAGVQRDVGWNLVVDGAYVGNAARRQSITRELNGRPYGYRFQPSSLDPTNVNNGVTQPLPDDLLRPYPGYASISQREFTGYADYHSVQLSATRRRRADGLAFGAAYTYEIVNKTLGAIDPFLEDNRARNYNSVGRRPHTLNIHYSWLVPGVRRSSRALRAILNDWQLSGVTSFLSGAQGGFTYTYRSAPQGELTDNGSIGGGPNRPRIVCDPWLPRSQRTFQRQFRTECIAAPDDAYHFGTARGDEFQGPGYANWDISVFKHFPMGGSRRLQLRVELYNAFNTYQWTTVNTNAEFDFVTGALANPGVFGRLTGETNSARRMQLAARFTF